MLGEMIIRLAWWTWPVLKKGIAEIVITRDTVLEVPLTAWGRSEVGSPRLQGVSLGSAHCSLRGCLPATINFSSFVCSVSSTIAEILCYCLNIFIVVFSHFMMLNRKMSLEIDTHKL